MDDTRDEVDEILAGIRAPHFMERGWWHDAEGDR